MEHESMVAHRNPKTVEGRRLLSMDCPLDASPPLHPRQGQLGVHAKSKHPAERWTMWPWLPLPGSVGLGWRSGNIVARRATSGSGHSAES
eukprot:6469777-Amphidinium_carterae.3